MEARGTGDLARLQRPLRGVQRAQHVGRRDDRADRSEEHTSELQSRLHLVCRLLLEKKKKLASNLKAYAEMWSCSTTAIRRPSRLAPAIFPRPHTPISSAGCYVYKYYTPDANEIVIA